jgi:hypothetical protein
VKTEMFVTLCGTLAGHATAATFGEDAAFLQKYIPLIMLGADCVLVAGDCLEGKLT